MQLHLAADRAVIDPRSHTRQGHRVADQDRPVDALGAQDDAHDTGWQMEAVEDDAGVQSFVGQLIPNGVGMAPEGGRDTVAQVSGEAGPAAAAAAISWVLASECP